MKKTLAIILSLTVIFSVLQMNVFAAKENFVKISEVTVNEVYSPAAGTEVQFTANCETDHVAIENVLWYEKKTKSETGSPVSKGSKFRPGYYYTATVQLKIAHSAYYFEGNGSSVTATVNGKAATVTTLGTAQKIKVSYTFSMCLATVSKFNFNLAAPTAGAAPHYPLLTGTGYESNNRGNNGAAFENGIYWRNETDNKVLYPRENPKFEAGKTYSANITVATTTGYRVASSYTVTVNGKTVPSTKVDNECIAFKVEFKVPKAHTHTSSEWKTDAEGHWKICTDTSCGAVSVSKESHKDANSDNRCDICNYEISKADTPTTNNSTDSKPDTNENENPSATDPEADTSPVADADAEDEGKSDNDSDGAWIWVVLAVVVLLAAGGIVTFVVLKKKKAE